MSQLYPSLVEIPSDGHHEGCGRLPIMVYKLWTRPLALHFEETLDELLHHAFGDASLCQPEHVQDGAQKS